MVEFHILTADRDGDWIDLDRPFRDSVQIRRPSSGNPVLDYNLQEGDDYGAFLRYDSSYDGDNTDNRLVIGTEDTGNDYDVLSADRDGSWTRIHRDTNISGNLYLDGSVSGTNGVDLEVGDGQGSRVDALQTETGGEVTVPSGNLDMNGNDITSTGGEVCVGGLC